MMAIGRGDKLGLVQAENTGYLSDESDFYGDEYTVSELEHRAEIFDVVDWWKNRTPMLTEIANQGIAENLEKGTATLYNPYEGDPCGRQLGETVEEFLTRLPPATTRLSIQIPWIFIANPFRKAPARKREQEQDGNKIFEGPPAEDSEWARFVVLGTNLLKELTVTKNGIEMSMTGKAKGTITRAVNVEKERIVNRLLETASELHCTSGKWMMFCTPIEVNAVWSIVARATAGGALGIAAKVGPDDGKGGERLICVYTKDFNDIQDLTRIIRKMKNLGLVEGKRTLYYKCDAYTWLGLKSSNELNIKASLYNSTDALDGKIKSKSGNKVDSLLYKKKEDSGDWRELEHR